MDQFIRHDAGNLSPRQLNAPARSAARKFTRAFPDFRST
jgi:hypothetical protein